MGLSRSYSLESGSIIIDGIGVSINILGIAIVFKDLLSQAGFILI